MPKISELNEITSAANNDYLVVAHDIYGAPSSRRITVDNFFNNIPQSNSNHLVPVTNHTDQFVLKWDDASNSAIWSVPPSIHSFTYVGGTSYGVQKDDEIIFVNTVAVNNDITVVLDDVLYPVIGKVYTIKNINAGSGHKVRVTTFSGQQSNTNLIEDPETNSYNVYVDITYTGDTISWIFDGVYYRHLNSHSSLPNFYYSSNTYAQLTSQNRYSGSGTSTDIVAYNDAGNVKQGTGPFIDMGIDGSTYTDTSYGTLFQGNTAYIYNWGGDLIIGPQTDNSIKFFAGNTNVENVWMTVNTSYVSVNNFIVLSNTIGPYSNDAAAAIGGVPVQGLYYDSTGTVKIRLA